MLTKDNPERLKRDLEIVDLRLQGKTYRDIAKEKDISIGQVHNILSDDKLREIIKGTMRVYAAHAKGIGKEFLKLCYDQDKQVKLKAIDGYHKIMGLLGTHTQNLFIQNLMVQQNNFFEDQAFRKVAMDFLGLPETGEVPEGE